MSEKKQGYIVHTKSQKLFSWLAFIALFVCGVMVGMGWSDKNAEPKQNLTQTVQKVQNQESQETCEIIEEILSSDLYGPGVWDNENPTHDIEIYQKLIVHGCPENVQKYQEAIEIEQQIINALVSKQNKSTCEQIEASLLGRLPNGGAELNSDARIERAKIYANLSERGCPVNSQKYVALAQQELEIARALEDDEFSEKETIEVVETYKRLNMQAAAQEIFETAKKLTNPAIDFILEVEKIINEK